MNYSQQKLADALGVNLTTVFNWERGSGKRIPPYLHLALKSLEREKRQRELGISETSFRAISFDLANDAIVIYEAGTGNIIDINEKWCEMFGYNREETLRLKIEDITSRKLPYTAEDFMTVLTRVKEKGPQLVEWLVKHRSGDLFWLEINCKSVIIEGREWMVSIGRDITEKKLAEKKLQESKEKFEALMNATTESAFLIDLQYRILAVNNTGAGRLGSLTDKMTGRCLFDYFPPDVARSRKSRIDEVIRSGKPVRFEDKREGMIFNCNFFPVFDDRGEVKEVALFATDITELKKAVEEQRNLIEFQQALIDSLPASETEYAEFKKNFEKMKGLS